VMFYPTISQASMDHSELTVNSRQLRHAEIRPDRPAAPLASTGWKYRWHAHRNLERNSVRPRLPRLVSWLADSEPDVLLVQETEATEEPWPGVHPKIVSERLGHAKVSITLDVYSHAVPTVQRDGASKLATLVFGGAQ
jgi:hypothetical protein